MLHSLRFAMSLLIVPLFVGLCSPTRAELKSYWNFDDGTTATDQVGSINGISFEGGATFAADTHITGSGGGAFSLDLRNGNDYVTLPVTNYSITDTYTIAGWVKRNGTPAGNGGILSIQRDLTGGGGDRTGVNLGLSDDDVYTGLVINPASPTNNNTNTSTDSFHDYRTTNTNVSSISGDTWTHVAATLRNDKITMYVNGIPETTYSLGTGTGFNETPAGVLKRHGRDIDFNVGAGNGSFSGFGADGTSSGGPDFTTTYFDGLVDEVGVWNNGLALGQINQLAQGVAPNQLQAGVDVAIVNPGFELDAEGETGAAITGWAVANNDFFISEGLALPFDPDAPSEGNVFLTANREAGGVASNPTSVTATQEVDLSAFATSIDAGGLILDLQFDYYIQSGESGEVTLSFLDEDGLLIDSVFASDQGTPDEFLVDTNPSEWAEAILSDFILPGTRSIEIEIAASRPGGTVTNVGFDNFSATLNGTFANTVPEPATLTLWSLVAMVSFGAYALRRRSKLLRQ